MKKSQVAVEYILIVTISFIILMSGIYFIKNYAVDSNDRIIKARVAEVANDIIINAGKMYYYGAPSKSTITINMPGSIENMFILAIPKNNEYYLVFRIQASAGYEDLFFESDVPIAKSADIENCPDIEGALCEYFPERVYSKGTKTIKIEATEKCLSEGACVSIEEFIS